MVIDYLIENFTDGEPIFLEEIPANSKDYLRQEMKKLVDEGRLERLYNGVYYLPYVTSLLILLLREMYLLSSSLI